MEAYDSLQAKREAEAKKRATSSRGATGISFAAPSPTKPGPAGAGASGPAVGGSSTTAGGLAPSPSTGAFQPTGAFGGPQPSGTFAPKAAFGGPQPSGAFQPSGTFGAFQPSGTFGSFKPSGQPGAFGAGSVGGVGGSSTVTGASANTKEQSIARKGSLGGGGDFSPANDDDLQTDSGEGRRVAMGTAGQHQRQTDTATKLSKQMQAFGIAQMVLPADEAVGGGNGGNRNAKGDVVGITKGGGEVSNSETTQDLLSMIPRRGLFQCYVMREKSSFKTMMNPNYTLFATRNNKFLLAGRKRANKQTSNYLVSLDQNDLERASPNFFGKVRSNLAGTEFIVYDKGCKPAEMNEEQGKFVREELMGILYETNVAGMSGPRKMKVILPALAQDNTHKRWVPMTDEESIIAAYKKNPDSPEFIVLTTKEPTWNEQLRQYSLDFHGRVTKVSVKNFQLCDVKNPKRVVFQFGKVDDDKFNMDFQYPLTAFQAFGLALTAFDNKLACK